MEKSKLINEFIEGSIKSEEEQLLFQSLSADQDLRQELRQSIAVDRAFDKRLSAMMPSTESTKRVFSSLGMAGFVSDAGSAGLFGGFFSGKLFTFIAGVLLTSLAAFILYFAALEDKSQPVIAQSQPGLPSLYSFESGFDRLNYFFYHGSTSSDDVPMRIVYIYKEPETGNYYLADNKSQLSMLQSSFAAPHRPIETLRNSFVPIETFYEAPYNSIAANFNPVEQYGISVEVRGMQYWSTPQADEIYSYSPKFSNMGIAALYSLSEALEIGIDLRQEKFYQSFNGENNGNTYLYEQNPSFLGVSALARYNLLSSDSYKTYLQLGVGGIQTGITGRALVGLSIYPTERLSLDFGLEQSILRYEHQSRVFWSNKFGLHYGVGLHF